MKAEDVARYIQKALSSPKVKGEIDDKDIEKIIFIPRDSGVVVNITPRLERK